MEALKGAALAAAVVLADCIHGVPPNASPNDLTSPVSASAATPVRLVAELARWRPDSADPHFVDVPAFAIEGAAPSVPGPLLRTRPGDTIALSIRNTLGDTMLLFGFGQRRGQFDSDTIRVDPGQSRDVRVAAPPSGTWSYYALLTGSGHPRGPGAHELLGVIQSGEGRPGERLLAINAWQFQRDSTNPGPDFVFWSINGRSWPSTERFTFDVGDSVRWRLVDLTGDEHPMHLHGFFFRVDGRTGWSVDSVYAPERRRWAVTEVPPPGGSVAITWVPSRPGGWLLHCHKAPHMGITSHLGLDRDSVQPPMTAHVDAASHLATRMGGLIVGITVRGPARAADTGIPAPRLRLLIQRRPGVLDRGRTDAYGYVLQRGAQPAADSVELPGPVLVLPRDALAEITVVNRLPVATTVHWHGIELDSYYDGVGGWSGWAGRTAPILAPGDSFIVRMRPPRAGTFIYHTHLSESPQLNRGLVGALIVTGPGRRYDPATDHVVLLHVLGNNDSALVIANGTPADTLKMSAGVSQRLRFIAMLADDVADVMLTADTVPLTWRAVAKDGADLAPAGAATGPARLHITPGETYDVEFTPRRGPLMLRVKSFNNFVIPIMVR